MSEATSGAGADTTPAAPADPANSSPVSTSLLTDGEGGQQQAAEPTTTANAEADGQASTKTDASDGDGKTAPKGAPEAYEDFTAPEGVQLDTTTVEDLKGLAKELNLDQGTAQKVADLLGKQAQAKDTALASEISRVSNEWVEQVKADPEIGGDKLNENLATARQAMEATTTPQLRALLQRTGLGNNPEVIRHFLKIAPAFAEDKHVPGGKAPAGSGKSAAQVLYDATN